MQWASTNQLNSSRAHQSHMSGSYNFVIEHVHESKLRSPSKLRSAHSKKVRHTTHASPTSPTCAATEFALRPPHRYVIGLGLCPITDYEAVQTLRQCRCSAADRHTATHLSQPCPHALPASPRALSRPTAGVDGWYRPATRSRRRAASAEMCHHHHCCRCRPPRAYVVAMPHRAAGTR